MECSAEASSQDNFATSGYPFQWIFILIFQPLIPYTSFSSSQMTALVHYVLLSIAFCFVKMTVKLIWILKNDLSYILKQECHQSLQVDFFLNVYFFF